MWAPATRRVSQVPVVVLLLRLLAVGVANLYGGEAHEVIRFMESDSEAQLEHEEEEYMIYIEKLQQALRAIEQHPLVSRVSLFGDGSDLNKTGVSVTLSSQYVKRARQQFVVHTSEKEGRTRDGEQTRPKPTQLDAARAAILKLATDYKAEVAHFADDSSCTSAVAPTPEKTAFDTLKAAAAARSGLEKHVVAMQQAVHRACEFEHSAVLEREAAERALSDAQAALNAFGPSKKKPRKCNNASNISEASAGSALAYGTSVMEDETDEQEQPTWLEWNLSRWRKHEREVQRRRAVEIDQSNEQSSPPPRGDDSRGWRLHWRRGIKGCIQDWAEGSPYRVAFMLATLAEEFDVVDPMAERLSLKFSAEEVKQARTDKYIVDRLRAAIHSLKRCRSEAERMDLHVVLGAVAPRRRTERNEEGMIRRVAERLGVQRGSRYERGGSKRPRVLEQAITRRAAFDDALELNGPLKPGDSAISRGRPCTVLDINYEANTCTLLFHVASVKLKRDYKCIYKGRDEWCVVAGCSVGASRAAFPKGSARLTRLVPSLRPVREMRKDEKAEKARPKVEELFNAEGARSPSQRDCVQRRVGVAMYETAQALYIYSKFSALYALYLLRYPSERISFSLFKRLRPWYVRRSRERTCECKHCTNFKNYMTIHHSLANHFNSLLNSPTADCDNLNDGDVDESEVHEWEGKAALQKLLNFCALESKSQMVKFALCDGALSGAGLQACINSTCPTCGFDKLWSKGLRKLVVDENNNVRDSAPIEFQAEFKWLRIQSSKTSDPGEASQSSYVESCGTVVQFLDEFESTTMRKFPHHRFTIKRQKETAAQFERNRGPGWVQSDVDFAMDGTIPPPGGISIQSDHWSPMSFTLFVQWSLLPHLSLERRNLRMDHIGHKLFHYPLLLRSLPLLILSYSNTVFVVTGLMGTVISEPEPELVERRYLRHRKLQTKVFAHFSDDKTHDSHAAQTFLDKTFAYMEEHFVKTGNEKFFAWHMHSDNAPSHFKSSKTMYYFSKLQGRLACWADGCLVRQGRNAGTPLSFRIYWEFGAPGHGKGVWDGIGAWLKRTVRGDIVDHRPDQQTILLSKGTILSPNDVAQHLMLRYDNPEFVESHREKTINQVVVFYTPTHEITRPKPDHEYEKMQGMKKTFLFMSIRTGVVLQRKFACWCSACLHASAPGEGTMDSNYVCHDCDSGSLVWEETSIDRNDAAGIANSWQRTRNKARELRNQLKQHFQKSNQPLWIAVQNRGELEPDQYWVGRALRIEEEHTEGGYVAGVNRRERYDAGDIEIVVEWFERDISGGDERRIFKLWTQHTQTNSAGPVAGHTYTVNSTELRAIGGNVEMTPIPPIGGAPLNVVRRGEPRAAAGAARHHWQQGMVRRVHEQRADPPDQLWEISSASERLILDWCT